MLFPLSTLDRATRTRRVPIQHQRLPRHRAEWRTTRYILTFIVEHRVEYLLSQKSDSEMSSLVDEPPKKKARAKSKVDPAFPLRHFTMSQPYIPILTQNSEAGKSSKRPKPSSHILSKDEETIKRLKVPIPDFVGLIHASYLLNVPSPSS